MSHTHNNWRRPPRGLDAYDTTISLLNDILKLPHIINKIEVSSVVSKNNIDEIPSLMKELARLGVKRYSAHRFFQVGRGWKNTQLVPSARDYLVLLIRMLETADDLGMEVHLHHSLESMYATLLLGLDTYAQDKVGNPVRKSSIAINPRGEVYFDPWCMKPPWRQLFVGSLLAEGSTLQSLLHDQNDGILDIARQYTHRTVRCKGCMKPCSGGARIAAAANFIVHNNKMRLSEVTLSHLCAGLAEIDPACPLYWDGYRGNCFSSPEEPTSAGENEWGIDNIPPVF